VCRSEPLAPLRGTLKTCAPVGNLLTAAHGDDFVVGQAVSPVTAGCSRRMRGAGNFACRRLSGGALAASFQKHFSKLPKGTGSGDDILRTRP